MQFENKHFGFDISSPDIRKISLKPLKTIWQWAEAAGIIHQVYDGKMTYRNANFVGSFYYYDSTRPKAQETLERLVADLEKED